MKEKELLKTLKNLNILLVTHSRATGFSQMLDEWLKGKTKIFTFIDHPLLSSKKTKSSMAIHQVKGKERDIFSPSIVAPSIFIYIKDFIVTIVFVLMSKKNYDLGIGVDNLNTLSLLLLRKIGRIKKVIYHTVDYTPNRFFNTYLNKIYHTIDRYCCYHADMLWNSSGRMNGGRVKYGMNENKIVKTIITPDGSNFDPKKRLTLSKINKNQIVFLGHLRPDMGLKLLISSMPEIIKQIPNVKLLIIGDGPLMQELKKFVEKYKIIDSVNFTGFIPDHNKVDDLLKKSAIGIAIFEPTENSIEYYSDVGKPKVYLAAGIPVVITKIPEIAFEIENQKAGIAIAYDKKSLVNAVLKLLKNENLYKEYRQNAIRLSKKYVWKNIFSEAFNETLEYLNIN